MTYTPLTDDEKRAMTETEIQQRIAELEAALEDLRRPVPQPYPKWVTVGGIDRIVESEEEEQRLQKADAEAKKAAEAKKDAEAEHAGAGKGETHGGGHRK